MVIYVVRDPIMMIESEKTIIAIIPLLFLLVPIVENISIQIKYHHKTSSQSHMHLASVHGESKQFHKQNITCKTFAHVLHNIISLNVDGEEAYNK